MSGTYIVKGKSGAVVRAGLEKDTDLVKELTYLQEVKVEKIEKNKKGEDRCLLSEPVKGWTTLKLLDRVEGVEGGSGGSEAPGVIDDFGDVGNLMCSGDLSNLNGPSYRDAVIASGIPERPNGLLKNDEPALVAMLKKCKPFQVWEESDSRGPVGHGKLLPRAATLTRLIKRHAHTLPAGARLQPP